MIAIEKTVDAGCTHLSLRGRLDALTSTDLERSLNALPDNDLHRLCIDASGLDYVSSAGLRVLLSLAKRCKSLPGKVALHGLQPSVARVFELTGFHQIVPLFPTRDQAVAALQ